MEAGQALQRAILLALLQMPHAELGCNIHHPTQTTTKHTLIKAKELVTFVCVATILHRPSPMHR